MGLGLPLYAMGRVASFSPLDVADCRLWLRADLGITLNGGDVATWADQSGAGDSNRNAVQGTGAAQPLYVASDANFDGQPTVSFDGSNHFMPTGAFTGGPYAQPVTVYSAHRAGTTARYVYDDIDGTSRLILYTGGSPDGFFFAGSSVGVDLPTGTTYIVAAVYNGASSAIYVNDSGSAAATGDPGSNALSSFTLGARFNANEPLDGQIAEFIAYSGAHDSSTRQLIMQYMGGRYGVSVP